MYDDYESDDVGHARPVRRWLLIVFVVLMGLALVGAGAGVLLSHRRIDHANADAVKYGLATSKKHVSLTARCTAELRAHYSSTANALEAGTTRVLALVAPKVCALGVQQGLVQPDGYMTYDDSANLAAVVMDRMGLARIQTMLFTHLAVTYHLARPGKATRWDRCVAMGYSGYDAQTAAVKKDYPPRPRFFRAVRQMCTVGIARGLVPPSGAPSRRVTALLLQEALSH